MQASIPVRSTYQYQLRDGVGSIWTTDIIDGIAQLVRIDPTTNTVTAEIALGARGDTLVRSDIAFAGGLVWTSSNESLLVAIDPATNTVAQRYGAEQGGGGVTATADAVWFSTFAKKTLYRLPLQA